MSAYYVSVQELSRVLGRLVWWCPSFHPIVNANDDVAGANHVFL